MVKVLMAVVSNTLATHSFVVWLLRLPLRLLSAAHDPSLFWQLTTLRRSYAGPWLPKPHALPLGQQPQVRPSAVDPTSLCQQMLQVTYTGVKTPACMTLDCFGSRRSKFASTSTFFRSHTNWGCTWVRWRSWPRPLSSSPVCLPPCMPPCMHATMHAMLVRGMSFLYMRYVFLTLHVILVMG